MLVPTEPNSIQLEIKKSRFLSFAQRIDSVDEIKGQLNTLRALHPQANHVVHAAIVGKEGSQFSYSDDREPKNTAGRPMLEVLKGSGITNILVMVVRYFGGTKLGTGGLVRAYSDAAKTVLQELKTEELVEKTLLTVILEYDIYEQVKKVLEELKAETEEEFGTSVTIRINVATHLVEALKEKIINLSSSRARFIV
ncbi:MAG: YigZ family protein [Sphaerochaetaceae bacterium]